VAVSLYEEKNIMTNITASKKNAAELECLIINLFIFNTTKSYPPLCHSELVSESFSTLFLFNKDAEMNSA
jgi:hypothetical protein